MKTKTKQKIKTASYVVGCSGSQFLAQHIDNGGAAPGELLSPHFYLSPVEAGSSPCGTLFMGDLSVVCK